MRQEELTKQHTGHPFPDGHSLAYKLVSRGRYIPWPQKAAVDSPE